MDENSATAAFAALSLPTRLQVLRLLISEGHRGLLAGESGSRLDVRQNTMSANLSVRQQAGMIRSEREGRAIRYFADMDGVGALISFMLEDCCGGRPELCGPLIEEIADCGETNRNAGTCL